MVEIIIILYILFYCVSGPQVEVQKVQKVFEHSHVVQWLEKAVIDNIKGQEVSQFLYLLCQHTSLSALLCSPPPDRMPASTSVSQTSRNLLQHDL